MTVSHEQGEMVDIINAPWDLVDESQLTQSLLDIFMIANHPKLIHSFKPYVLFDEFYSDLYRHEKPD